MPTTTITLDERQFKAVADKARELGTTPEHFIHSLIAAATSTFDEILAPVREAFAKSGITEDELNDAVANARRSIHGTSQDAGHE